MRSSPNQPSPPGLCAGVAGIDRPPLELRWCSRALDLFDVDGFGALRPCLFLERDLGPLGERAIALRVDARVVDEQVPAALIGRDEAEALLVAKPFDCACWHGGVVLRGSKCCNRGGLLYTYPQGLHLHVAAAVLGRPYGHSRYQDRHMEDPM